MPEVNWESEEILEIFARYEQFDDIGEYKGKLELPENFLRLYNAEEEVYTP